MSDEKIYLDHNATTPIREEVLQAMQPYLQETFGNASSIHSFGREARYGLELAREQVANFIGADPEEIVFTSCGTESNNQAIRGVAKQLKGKGNQIITTTIEHSCVKNVCEELEADGFEVIRIECDEEGRVKAEDVISAITDKTILITVMHANNEVGIILPVAEIGKVAREKNILFHSDTVQSIGKIPVNVNDLNVDFLSISGHKNYAPKGCGILYIRKGIEIPPFISGGTHERGRRAGTENVAGCVGLGKAMELAAIDLDKKNKELAAMRDELEKEVLGKIPDAFVNGGAAERIPNTLNLGFLGFFTMSSIAVAVIDSMSHRPKPMNRKPYCL